MKEDVFYKFGGALQKNHPTVIDNRVKVSNRFRKKEKMKKTSYPMVVLEHFYYYCQSFVTTLHTQISKLMLRCNCMQKIKKNSHIALKPFDTAVQATCKRLCTSQNCACITL